MKEVYDVILYCKVETSTVAFWNVLNVLEMTVLFFFFYFILTAGSVFLCIGWVSIFLGELFLI